MSAYRHPLPVVTRNTVAWFRHHDWVLVHVHPDGRWEAIPGVVHLDQFKDPTYSSRLHAKICKYVARWQQAGSTKEDR